MALPKKPGKKSAASKLSSKKSSAKTKSKSSSSQDDGISTGLIIGITVACLMIGGIVIFLQTHNSNSDAATVPETAQTESTPTSSQPQNYVLKYNLTPGEKISFSTDLTMYTLLNEETESSNSMTMTSKTEWTIKETSSDGIANIDSIHKRYIFKDKSQNKEKIFDSDKPEGESDKNSFEQFSSIVKNVLTYQLNSQGIVTRVLGQEKLTNASIFTPEMLVSDFQKFFVLIPDHAIKVGESWNSTLQIKKDPNANPFNLNITYTLKDVKPEFYLIEAKGNHEIEGVKLEVSGNYECDPKSLLPQTINLNCEMIVSPIPDQKVKLVIKNTTKRI